MTEVQVVKVRFSAKNLIGVLLSAVVLVAFWSIVLPPLRSPAAYEAFIAVQQESSRCRMCGVPYPAAIIWIAATLGVFTGVFALAGSIAVLRVFGPPTLEVMQDGRAIYRLPWRERRFIIPPDANIKVGPAITFTPPAKSSDGAPIARLNLRTGVTDLGAARIRKQFAALRADWLVH